MVLLTKFAEETLTTGRTEPHFLDPGTPQLESSPGEVAVPGDQ